MTPTAQIVAELLAQLWCAVVAVILLYVAVDGLWDVVERYRAAHGHRWHDQNEGAW